jgi:lysosomal alpha-mannosidase
MGSKAIVHVTIDHDFGNVIQFDVDLDSMPTPYTDGYEFVATFDAVDFDNNKTFYTDSNGLDMQKRVLNHRSFYNFTQEWSDDKYPEHSQNISGNYYPVGSAISMKDLNDR